MVMRFRLPEGYDRNNITSAVLRLTPKNWVAKNVSQPYSINVHRLLKSWKEGTGDLSGPVNSAAVDGATALERFWGSQDGSENWSVPFVGLNDDDAASIATATLTKADGSMDTWEFDVTELAKAWADDTTQNFGVLITVPVFPADNATTPDYPEFYAREALVADSAKPTLILNGAPAASGAGLGATHFSKTASTVALWTFDEATSGQFRDAGSNGYHLTAPAGVTLNASPYGKAAAFSGQATSLADKTALSLAGTGLLTYEARVRMNAWPAYSQFGHSGTLIGMYAGLKLIIYYDGTISAEGQVGNNSTWNWYSTYSAPGTLPLGRWVDIAVAADRDNARLYVYVDGQPVQIYSNSLVAPGDKLRDLTTYPFVIGNDGVDNQPFLGEVDEIRVSRDLVLGPGPAVIYSPD